MLMCGLWQDSVHGDKSYWREICLKTVPAISIMLPHCSTHRDSDSHSIQLQIHMFGPLEIHKILGCIDRIYMINCNIVEND